MLLIDSIYRLPIDHPDYRYPSSRNPYWSKLRDLGNRVYSDNDTETHRGQWREIAFKSARELHVEIGCNAGHVVVEWASRNPRNAYVGLDWKFKMIHKAAEKISKRGIANLALFRAHAERIQFMFGPGEVDHLYLFFPDPWPKKAQWKNRFLTADRLRTIHPILRSDGIFHIKTDHPGYFQWMLDAVSQVGDLWEVVEKTGDLHADCAEPEKLEIPDVTLFEKLFIQDGIKIQSLKLKKVGPTA